MVVKIVDDDLFDVVEDVRPWIAQKLQSIYKLGTILHTPGSFLYFGLKIGQFQDFNITLLCEDKLEYISPSTISRMRRKDENKMLTKLETHSFSSLTGSIKLIGSNCIANSNFFQRLFSAEKKSGGKVQRMIKQYSISKQFKEFGAICQFCSVRGQCIYSIYVVYFAATACPCERGDLGYTGGLFIDEPVQESIFHSVDWHSHLFKRPAKLSGSAKTLVADKAPKTGLICVSAYCKLLGTGINFVLVVDRKALY